MPIPTLFWIGF